MKNYKENEEIIEQEYQADKKRAAAQNQYRRRKAAYYEDAREELYELYDKTCTLLERMYNKGIIYEKYQYDLVAVSMFAEYFKFGRCSCLEGHEGAYNIYENEIRLGVS